MPLPTTVPSTSAIVASGSRLVSRLSPVVEDLRVREDRLALVFSIVVGALVGLVVVAFVLLTGRLAAHMYPAGAAGWRRVVVPTLGALVSGFLLFRFFPEARGSGIPQTRAAIFIHDGRITLRTVLGKFVCCATSLASGIALGREGPSVHIGSGIASVIARRLGMSREQVRWLVPVGGAAALAAAFNTPIAAVPVVSRADARLLLGLVTLDDVLKTYGVGRAERRAAAGGASGGTPPLVSAGVILGTFAVLVGLLALALAEALGSERPATCRADRGDVAGTALTLLQRVIAH